MKKSFLLAVATSVVLVTSSLSTAFAHEGRDHRSHEHERHDRHSKTLKMDKKHRHARGWRDRDHWRHDRHWRPHRGYWKHRHDHWAYRPRYRVYDRVRIVPPRRDDHWGLQLFYFD